MDRSGGVSAFGPDGKRTWSITLGAEVAGAPLIKDHAVWLITRDGRIHVRALSDGAPRDRFALDILPESGLLASGAQPVVAQGRGTVRPLAPRADAPGKP
jgi:hypothetical protein